MSKLKRIGTFPVSTAKTEAYARDIEPLLLKIEELCEKHNIPIVCMCQISNPSDTSTMFGGIAALPEWSHIQMQVAHDVIKMVSRSDLIDILATLVAMLQLAEEDKAAVFPTSPIVD